MIKIYYFFLFKHRKYSHVIEYTFFKPEKKWMTKVCWSNKHSILTVCIHFHTAPEQHVFTAATQSAAKQLLYNKHLFNSLINSYF